MKCPKCSAALVDSKARFCPECGALIPIEAEPGADPMVGRVLADRYRIVRVLGEGGMGKVYLAEQRMGSTTRKVALKTLQPDLTSDPQIIARFHRETETVVQLQHPNTITFYEFGETSDGLLFIVMEYVQGESVAQMLTRGPLPAERVERILAQVCGSLAEAHGIGIIHRDLKPDNIVLTNRAGQVDFVKVLDFGIAKRTEFSEDDRRSKLTKQGMVLGTPPYMSPEQFTGQVLDGRSDIYSLGIMAYEMMTGRMPFDARTPWEWATSHMTQEPRPFDVVDPAGRLHDRHRAAILHALRKNRDERPPSVTDYLREFTGWGANTSDWMAGVRTPPPRSSISPPVSGIAPTAYHTPAMPAPSVTGRPPSIVTPGPVVTRGTGATAAPSSTGRWVILAAVGLLLVGGGVTAGVLALRPPRVTVAGAGDNTVRDVRPVSVEPIAPEVRENPVAARPKPVEPETPPPVEPPTTPGPTPVVQRPEPPDRPERPQVDPQERRGQAMARNGLTMVTGGQYEQACEALADAARLAGPRDTHVRNLKTALGDRAGIRIGQLMLRGQCPQAQQLFRRLQAVGAQGPARQHFSDWCPLPR